MRSSAGRPTGRREATALVAALLQLVLLVAGPLAHDHGRDPGAHPGAGSTPQPAGEHLDPGSPGPDGEHECPGCRIDRQTSVAPGASDLSVPFGEEPDRRILTARPGFPGHLDSPSARAPPSV
jgi:hypothetical protein